VAAKDYMNFGHETKSKSAWHGTETMLCGVTVDQDDVWEDSGLPDCPGCVAAKKAKGGGGFLAWLMS
jgi:hypothetical protein